jgi:hypothetical protein
MARVGVGVRLIPAGVALRVGFAEVGERLRGEWIPADERNRPRGEFRGGDPLIDGRAGGLDRGVGVPDVKAARKAGL